MNRLGDSYRYKNSNAKILKDGEIQRSINPAGGSIGGSRLVAASANFDAFVSGGNDVIATWRDAEEEGSNQHQQRIAKSHGDDITDIAFSPFDDQILATAAKDQMLKLWTLSSSSSSPASTLSLSVGGPVSSLRWHPAASGVIASAVENGVKIVDVEKAEVALATEAGEGKVQSVTWGMLNGSLLATTASDKMVSVALPLWPNT